MRIYCERLRIVFPEPESAEEALAALDRYDGPAPNNVKLAIVKLSAGELWRLRELVQTARRDHTNVTYPATMPEETQHRKQTSPSVRRWGALRPKPPSPNKAAATERKLAAMRERDRQQWLDWLMG